MACLYNEIDPFAAQWLRNLIDAGHLPFGYVDQRSIRELQSAPPVSHFFAGIGGWPLALELAGWPRTVPVWTGSCPCQPFSAAGKKRGFDDDRHLWPEFFRLIRECRPPIVFGEQVAGAAGYRWLDLVQADLAREGYALGAADLAAASVGAPQIRQRLYWAACADRERLEGVRLHLRARRSRERLLEVAGGGEDVGMAAAQRVGLEGRVDSPSSPRGWRHTGTVLGPEGEGQDERFGIRRLPDGAIPPGATGSGFWREADWLYCRDEKIRPVERGTIPLVDEFSGDLGRNRTGCLKGYGNAIVPELAAVFIQAVMEALDL